MGINVQFFEMEILIDCQIELLEIFMQQNYEVIVFSSNNLLEIDFLKCALRNELARHVSIFCKS